jgi:hypothetical protein
MWFATNRVVIESFLHLAVINLAVDFPLIMDSARITITNATEDY